MKRFIVCCLSAILACSLAAFAVESRVDVNRPSAGPKKETKTVVFTVSMHCQKCVKKINDNIAFEKGVKALDVNLESKTVKVTYDASKTDVAKLKTALEKLGYKVTVS